MKPKFVSCLCPTYRRPRLLANALACYLTQDYPAEQRELIILDDAGQFISQCGVGWELVSVKRRFRSLPEKFNALAGMAKGDFMVIWEDDDIYLPWHISAHVAALGDQHRFSKPSRVRSHFEGSLQEEAAEGRFHASIAFTRKALTEVQGWPITSRGDFDQEFLSRLTRLGPVADPLVTRPCSYIFRWEPTLDYHGQEFMTTPEDETWYERIEQKGTAGTDLILSPRFDENTLSCWPELELICRPFRKQLRIK